MDGCIAKIAAIAAPTGDGNCSSADKYRARVTASPVLSMRAPKAKFIPPIIVLSTFHTLLPLDEACEFDEVSYTYQPEIFHIGNNDSASAHNPPKRRCKNE